jgi:hypothetical protein
MFERPHATLLPRRAFAARFVRFAAYGGVLIVGSLGLGALGYHHFERLSWLDSVYSAAMILTGMGPTCEVRTSGGKVFVTLYALFSALIFLTAGTLVASPLLHRLLHRFHLEEQARRGQH